MMMLGIVQQVLHKGALEQGFLTSMQGLGALFGALFVASAASKGRGTMFLICGALLGCGILAFAISTSFWVSLPIMLAIGAGQSTRMALGQVLIQRIILSDQHGERLRARSHSLHLARRRTAADAA